MSIKSHYKGQNMRMTFNMFSLFPKINNFLNELPCYLSFHITKTNQIKILVGLLGMSFFMASIFVVCCFPESNRKSIEKWHLWMLHSYNVRRYNETSNKVSISVNCRQLTIEMCDYIFCNWVVGWFNWKKIKAISPIPFKDPRRTLI